MRIVGQTFRNGRKEFKVLGVEDYPPSKVTRPKILDFAPDLLVAISYRGVLIPNITRARGVARILSVEVDGEIIDRPGAISEAIGIKEAMKAYEITPM